MTRRDFGLALSAASTASAAASPQLDPVAWTQSLYANAPLTLTWKPGAAAGNHKAHALAWQRRLRPKLQSLLGSFPTERVALQPEVQERRDFADYTRERILFTSRPGVQVSAYLLLPRQSRQQPSPVMLCVPGHGRGADDIVGIDEKGQDRTDRAGYQRDFALQAVEQGFAALAIEPMAFGCRRDHINKARGAGHSACQPTAGAALLLGQTMIGWRVWDLMRSIDYLETRREVDAKRIGCMGISGGGTATLFTAALEPRVRAAYVSGYLNTFRDSILSLSHCIDNYVPGILNYAEMYDVAGLIAPRPLFIESGEDDTIFPVEAARRSFQQAQRVYAAMNAAPQIQQEVFPAAHVFWGKEGWKFLREKL
jgi:dienelactone hydrolase